MNDDAKVKFKVYRWMAQAVLGVGCAAAAAYMNVHGQSAWGLWLVVALISMNLID